jgi:tRNA(Ile)-lysidine synthase
MERWAMFPAPGGLILCAVSGGEDSMCLLHLLAGLGKEKNFRVAAVHLNHLMRGEDASRDEAFVRDFCKANDIPFYAGHCDVRARAKEQQITVEEAGRQARYELFYKTADAIGTDKIATAHHALDQTETVLLHLVRGTGLDGLRGIPPVRGRLIRPLLNTSKAEIRDYCRLHGIAHVEDSTNDDLNLSRNRVRQLVVPQLQTINPALEEAVCRTADILRTEDDYLNSLARERLGEGTSVSCRTLQSAPPALQPRMLRVLIDRLGVGKKDFTAGHLADLLKLAEVGREGSGLHLPQGVRAQIHRGALIFSVSPPKSAEEMPLLPGENQWGKYLLTVSQNDEKIFKKSDTIYLRYDMMKQHLSVRTWRTSDRLILPGSRGERSGKRIFADRGIRECDRDVLPVICVDGQPAAIFTVGTDERYTGTDCAITIE